MVVGSTSARSALWRRIVGAGVMPNEISLVSEPVEVLRDQITPKSSKITTAPHPRRTDRDIRSVLVFYGDSAICGIQGTLSAASVVESESALGGRSSVDIVLEILR